MVKIHLDHAVHVRQTDEHEVVQAFELDRTDERLDVRVHVRTVECGCYNSHAFFRMKAFECFPQKRVELLTIELVIIADQVSRINAMILEIHHSVACLLDEPVVVRTECREAAEHAPCFVMDERDAVCVLDAVPCEDRLLKEVAGDDCVHVDADELLPREIGVLFHAHFRWRVASRHGRNFAFLFVDSLDGGVAHNDREFPDFAADSFPPPLDVLFGDADYGRYGW